MTAQSSTALAIVTEGRRPATTAGLLRVELLDDEAKAASLWRAVEAAAGIDAIAATWDWTETWLCHYGDIVRHRFAVGYTQDGACGVALITNGVHQRVGPLPVRTVHLGTAGEPMRESVCVEYNRLLVLPSHRTEFVSRLVEIVRREFRSWDKFELNGFSPHDADLLIAAESSFRVSRRVCHVADLEMIRENGGDVSRALRKSVGAKIRKNLRRFEERYGPIVGTWITDLEQARPAFDELAALHQARWTAAGFSGTFASTRFLGFHKSIIDRFLPIGRVVHYRATAGDQVLGIFYGFVDRGVIYHYQWGLAHFDEKNLAPGFVVGALCMQEALERGYDELNWLAGDVRYKRELATTSRELVWAEWHRGPWMAAIDALIATRHWIRDRLNRGGPRANGETA
jgi:CelD/BcsL family acetyltransferase involved in cellulose biosynthesis